MPVFRDVFAVHPIRTGGQPHADLGIGGVVCARRLDVHAEAQRENALPRHFFLRGEGHSELTYRRRHAHDVACIPFRYTFVVCGEDGYLCIAVRRDTVHAVARPGKPFGKALCRKGGNGGKTQERGECGNEHCQSQFLFHPFPPFRRASSAESLRSAAARCRDRAKSFPRSPAAWRRRSRKDIL